MLISISTVDDLHSSRLQLLVIEKGTSSWHCDPEIALALEQTKPSAEQLQSLAEVLAVFQDFSFFSRISFNRKMLLRILPPFLPLQAWLLFLEGEEGVCKGGASVEHILTEILCLTMKAITLLCCPKDTFATPLLCCSEVMLVIVKSEDSSNVNLVSAGVL